MSSKPYRSMQEFVESGAHEKAEGRSAIPM